MTETENIASFVSALNEAIESARTRLGEPDAFLTAIRDIESLIETGLPPVLEAAHALPIRRSCIVVTGQVQHAVGDQQPQFRTQFMTAGSGLGDGALG